MADIEYGKVEPMDSFNRKLVENVHPADWTNPKPADKYNLVVIGAGTAGLVCAAGAAGLGAKVALIERHLLGGDCLNVGCVPSKALLRCAEIIAAARNAGNYGVKIAGDIDADFAAVMERVRRLRSRISSHDSAMRFKNLGVDVFFGEAKFTAADTVEIDGQELKFVKAVIATGARAAIPPIEGLNEAGFLTNETVFSLTQRPKKLMVLGGGPLGCEMAQAFRRLGSEVCIVEMTDHIMSREDGDAAKIVAEAFQRDGIDVLHKSEVVKIEMSGQEKIVHIKIDGDEKKIAVEQILVGAGRVPNVQGLNLEAAGVEYDQRKGVKVDDYLRTTNKNIFAAGDICLKHKFTHTADASARIVLANSLFGSRKKWSKQIICWCTYTSPAVAHTGLYKYEANEMGIEVDTFIQRFNEVDRAVTDGREDGLIKIHVKKGTDKILGATIVAENAGDMISEITLAMVNKIGLGKFANVIHPYPTIAESIRHVADVYNRTRLTPFIKKILVKWLDWKLK
ncbi:MAG: mercuric reductase [Planctomycetes bacterium GWF2_41_51]|nr:MAG: mercuric reductase [Planctomycetes bacterium GWF2_41_51]HBG27931.1 FAD-containing oxidoreductase [Phycisphaerales bacterium]